MKNGTEKSTQKRTATTRGIFRQRRTKRRLSAKQKCRGDERRFNNMKVNKKAIAILMVLILIFGNTVAFAQMTATVNSMSTLPQKAFNVKTNTAFNLTDLTPNKYNFLVYGFEDCSNLRGTLATLDKLFSIIKPGAVQAFYFDLNKYSNQQVLDIGSKGNLKNIILCSDPDSSKQYINTMGSYFSELGYDKTTFGNPFIVLINKNGEIKYSSTGSQSESSLYEALSQVTKNDNIFTTEFVNFGMKVLANNVKLRSSQATSSDVVSAYLKPSYTVNPEAASIKKLASEITANITSTGDFSLEYMKLKAIYTWIAKNIYYDNSNKSSNDPEKVLNSKHASSAGYSNLLSALCRAANIPNKAVLGYAVSSKYASVWTEAVVSFNLPSHRGWTDDVYSSNWTNHKWNEAFVDGRWVMLDVTWDSHNTYTSNEPQFKTWNPKGQLIVGGEPEWKVNGEVTYTYFDCSVEKMSELHKIIVYEPYPQPTPTPRPTATPMPTARPTATPVPTAKPTATPTPTPTTIDWSNGASISTPKAPATVSAEPTSAKVIVNQELIGFEAYNIGGNNYFKLRDIAKVVIGSEKQFEVTWDNDKKAINLISNMPYTAVGGEMSLGEGKIKEATLNTSTIYKDGVVIQLTAYTINANNFFKLRDLTQAFNIGVTWDGATQTVGIDTKLDYEVPK